LITLGETRVARLLLTTPACLPKWLAKLSKLRPGSQYLLAALAYQFSSIRDVKLLDVLGMPLTVVDVKDEGRSPSLREVNHLASKVLGRFDAQWVNMKETLVQNHCLQQCEGRVACCLDASMFILF
jgi:hypothetical protein